ncbi:MAG: ribonuclease HI family protein [Candidatus Colwellbacteria bacterium]|nr:ribonuclease HI family protein [Candidatus Colwellbacteria bacterium]MBI3274179.1 ribonuclease HI family protein [Candidatus Colwellbacteria bacterium]
MGDSKSIIIHTDGGARGNPGPAAIGVVIELPHGSTKEYGERIGNTTNNVAEYKAVIFALKKSKQLVGKNKAKNAEVVVKTDSELLCRQLNGIYKIKDKNLGLLFIEIWNLLQDFKSVIFTHVPRELNREADAMVNRALDSLDI